jgi:hypothetical protein
VLLSFFAITLILLISSAVGDDAPLVSNTFQSGNGSNHSLSNAILAVKIPAVL